MEHTQGNVESRLDGMPDCASSSGLPSENKRSDQALRTRERLLRAATQVIQQEGASSLTLEKVAAVAEVSKGGLLHHFRSKEELIVSLLDQTMERVDVELELRTEKFSGRRGAFASGYLDFVCDPNHAATDSSSSLLAAAASDDELLTPTRTLFDQWQNRLINDDGLTERTALLARIVGDGLWLIDLFGLAPPTAEQRLAVVELIQQQIDAETLNADE